jgi:uridylate kinase
MTTQLKYKRVMLKLTGELFGETETGKGIFLPAYDKVAEGIRTIVNEYDVQLAITVGAGNIFRGKASYQYMDDAVADYMGMLGTIINAIALQDALERIDVPTRVMTAISIPSVAEPFIRRKALRHLEKRRVVIMGGGTGNPFFTTDSAAALRASELNCEVVLKGTSVDGVYDKDPKKFSDAVKYNEVTYSEALAKNLEVMDATAFALCQRQEIPIIVFNIAEEGVFGKILTENGAGTLVHA